MSLGGRSTRNSPLVAAVQNVDGDGPFRQRALAWAMTYSPSSIADRYSTSSVTLPSTTLRYGVSRKP